MKKILLISKNFFFHFFLLCLFLFGCKTRYRIQSIASYPCSITKDSLTASSEMDFFLSSYRKELQQKLSDTLIYNLTPLSRQGIHSGLGKLVALAMKEAADSIFGKGPYTIFINRGGLRSELPSGFLTLGHLYELIPFDNLLCVKVLSEKELNHNLEILKKKDFILYNKHGLIGPEETEKLIQHSSSVLLSDFLLNGGDGLLLDKTNCQCSSMLIRDALVLYLRNIAQTKKILNIDSL